jgi:hypothetical protein
MSAGFQAEIRDAINIPEAGPSAPDHGSGTNGSMATTWAGRASESRPPTAEPRFLWSDLPPSSADGGPPHRPVRS